MTKTPNVIMLEFNELCPDLMQRFRSEGELPNFDRLYSESEVYTTLSDEEAPNLDPWIQWVTVHSGVPYQEHQIHDLGDGDRLAVDNVWDLASEAGLKVWVCGSMNASYRTPINGWVLPDPWMTRVAPYPSALRPYFRFVQANVTEYTAARVPITAAERARFLAFMGRHGISRETIAAIVRQLAGEAGTRGRSRWKRAVLLDRLQLDLFRWVFRKERPSLSTYFINSTAHYQHLYWRHMEPERFTNKPAPEEQSRFENAIRFGYRAMDQLVGRFLEMAGEQVTLVFCTALSQQPCLIYEAQGGKTIYRPRDFQKFLAALGIEGRAEVSPVMAHQFHLDFPDDATAADAEEKLVALQYQGVGRAMHVRRKGRRILTGCRVFQPVEPGAILTQGPRILRFNELFYHIDLVKSGMHHPDGMLWIRTPERRHAVHDGRVPLVSVAPTILHLLGLPRPAYMRGEPLELRRPAAA